MTEKTKNSIQLIDLGLPSGTLWADRNIGADSPEDYGDYFRFGETTPFTKDSQPFEDDGIDGEFAGTDRDAATVILGEEFRMPTIEQLKELKEECSHEWTTLGEVKGVKVTGPNGNSIFLPTAGFRSNGPDFLDYVGTHCYYWSASPIGGSKGRYLYINEKDWHWFLYSRPFGLPVRAVKG